MKSTFLAILVFGMCLCHCRLWAAGFAFDSNSVVNLRKLNKLSTASGIKVFWWNVAWGSHNSDGALDQNLTVMARSDYRPDIIVLGEYRSQDLNQKTHDLLKKWYPYQDHFTYSSSATVGIGIFSRSKFTRGGLKDLNWAPSSRSLSAQKTFKDSWRSSAPDEVRYWDRRSASYRFSINGSNFYLFPVHLLEPWKAIYDVQGKLGVMDSFFSKGSNPLNYQIEAFRSFVKSELGGNFESAPVLLLGDFNAPKSVLTLPSVSYSILSRNFTECFFGSPDTFPAASSPVSSTPPFSYYHMKIDHGLINGWVEKIGGGVIEMRGSDHYPIYVVIRPKSAKHWYDFLN